MGFNEFLSKIFGNKADSRKDKSGISLNIKIKQRRIACTHCNFTCRACRRR